MVCSYYPSPNVHPEGTYFITLYNRLSFLNQNIGQWPTSCQLGELIMIDSWSVHFRFLEESFLPLGSVSGG